MSWNFRAFLLGLGLLAMVAGFATRAHAADATLSWTLPTTYEDDTPIADGELRESVVEWIACDGTWPSIGVPSTAVFPAPAVTGTVSELTPGTWCFRVAAVTQLNAQSKWSNVATKVVPVPEPPKPKPPVLITIDIQATAALEQAADGSLKLTVR
jgi:hypothetical protein